MLNLGEDLKDFKNADYLKMTGTERTPREIRQKYYGKRGSDLRKRNNNNGEVSKRWQVSEMWDVHHEIARRIVVGQKNVAIAAALNLTQEMVSNVRNSPIVQDYISVMRGVRDAETIDLAIEIRESAPDALELLRDIISGEIPANPAVRVTTARDLLDRAGHGAPKKVFVETHNTHLTGDDILSIKQRALSGGTLAIEEDTIEEDTIDADVEEMV